MRPLRPLFSRHAGAKELNEAAEKLRNRDWVEILKVVHPAQAEQAEQEYLLSRLVGDWPSLTNTLIATHSQPSIIRGNRLIIQCDHNTFANEISLLASPIARAISARYGVNLQIEARASKKILWSNQTVVNSANDESPGKPPVQAKEQTTWDKLIDDISRI